MRKLFFIIVTVIGMMQIPMQSINAQNMKKEEVPQNISAFPVGKANTGFEQYFTGSLILRFCDLYVRQPLCGKF